MVFKSVKFLLVTAFSLCILLFSNVSSAQISGESEKTEKAGSFDPAKVIMEHILDAHEFHFLSYTGKDGVHHDVAIPLPVILYSPQRGFSAFSYANVHSHGHVHKGYKYEEGKFIAVLENGIADESVKVYDLSLTRNVVQMLLALILLTWIMVSVANKYKKNGTRVAPTGMQNLIEPIITFIRDEVGKPNLGVKYERYMPYLLTVFFFILINTLVGLVPGSANVTGNIAFTFLLALISLIVILFSTNRHFWGHIFWPPGVPFFVKVILIPVEILSIFIKPAALMIRLFANMVAGHIVITCFILLIFIFGEMNQGVGFGFAPVSLAFTIFIYLVEILIGFVQAFIFANLTAVFIGQAFEGEHHDGHDHVQDPAII